MNPLFIIIPPVSALVGWIIQFIFSHYFLQTYLPRKQPNLIRGISQKAQQYFDTELDIEEKLTNPKLVEKMMPMIESHIDEFLNVKLAQEIPMLSMFVGNKTTDKIKEVFINQLKQLFPKVMQGIAVTVKKEINIKSLVEDQLKNVNLTKEIRLAGLPGKLNGLGLLSGFFIGLINVVLIYLLK